MWETIKKLLRKGGGRFIIIEDNQPSFVLMSFEEYEKLLDGFDQKNDLLQKDETERVNQSLSQLKDLERKEELIEGLGEQEEEIKVEDLPF